MCSYHYGAAVCLYSNRASVCYILMEHQCVSYGAAECLYANGIAMCLFRWSNSVLYSY